MKKIGNEIVSYTTYDTNNPIDIAYSFLDNKDGESIRIIYEICNMMYNYSTPFGREVIEALGLFGGYRDKNEIRHKDNNFYNKFDKWCEVHNVKVYSRCRNCNKLIYVFERDLKNIPIFCFICNKKYGEQYVK